MKMKMGFTVEDGGGDRGAGGSRGRGKDTSEEDGNTESS